jgi:hypothetical protein
MRAELGYWLLVQHPDQQNEESHSCDTRTQLSAKKVKNTFLARVLPDDRRKVLKSAHHIR